MGVPQGSILSVTLVSVKINSITQCLKTGVDSSLYVDDAYLPERRSPFRSTAFSGQIPFVEKTTCVCVCGYICQEFILCTPCLIFYEEGL